MPVRRLSAAVLMALTTTSCVEGTSSFRTRFEPGFAASATTISVLGVFQDGHMSREAWALIGPPLSKALGQHACEVGHGDKLASANPELLAAIDESVRSEGITEEMLARVSPAAEGELVLVLSMRGHTTTTQVRPAEPPPGQGRPPPRPDRAADPGELRIGGTLFSVRLHRPVARIDMSYVGPNLDDAIGRFVTRLGAAVPGSTCRGWRWAGPQPTPPVF